MLACLRPEVLRLAVTAGPAIDRNNTTRRDATALAHALVCVQGNAGGDTSALPPGLWRIRDVAWRAAAVAPARAPCHPKSRRSLVRAVPE